VVKKTQLCMPYNKRTNWDFFHEQAKTLNIQMSLKDHNDIIRAIEYFNMLSNKQLGTQLSDTIEDHISTTITIREKLKKNVIWDNTMAILWISDNKD